jgi:hypothetical protein
LNAPLPLHSAVVVGQAVSPAGELNAPLPLHSAVVVGQAVSPAGELNATLPHFRRLSVASPTCRL